MTYPTLAEMIKIKIDISGPGGCVNYDAELIRMTLSLLGYQVSIKNDYPIEDQVASMKTTVDGFMEKARPLGAEEMPKISMTVYNSPWGG